MTPCVQTKVSPPGRDDCEIFAKTDSLGGSYAGGRVSSISEFPCVSLSLFANTFAGSHV